MGNAGEFFNDSCRIGREPLDVDVVSLSIVAVSMRKNAYDLRAIQS